MSISRRTVVQGAAWSVPVLALAPVAHAYTFSGKDITIESFGGPSYKCPGNSSGVTKGYYTNFTLKSSGTSYSYDSSSVTFSVSVVSGNNAYSVAGFNVGGTVYYGTSLPVDSTVAETTGKIFFSQTAGTFENGASESVTLTLVLTITYVDRDGVTQTDTSAPTTVTFNSEGNQCSSEFPKQAYLN